MPAGFICQPDSTGVCTAAQLLLVAAAFTAGCIWMALQLLLGPTFVYPPLCLGLVRLDQLPPTHGYCVHFTVIAGICYACCRIAERGSIYDMALHSYPAALTCLPARFTPTEPLRLPLTEETFYTV